MFNVRVELIEWTFKNLVLVAVAMPNAHAHAHALGNV